MSAKSDGQAVAGHYNDGLTARRQQVRVALEGSTLVVRDLDGREIARWPLDEIAGVDEGAPDGSLRLRWEKDELGIEGARLTLEEPGPIAALTERRPQLRHGGRIWGGDGWRGFWRMAGLVVACVAVVALLVVFVLPQAASSLARAIPVGWEEALGERLSEQVVEVFGQLAEGPGGVCTAAAGEAALERLTERLARAVDSPYQFRVRVLDLKPVNAFALPGGYVFILRGLLEDAESPNEVAGVLAHEMGHVIRRHGTEALIRQVGLLIVFSAMFGEAGQGMADLGAVLAGLAYSRDAELEADRTAVTLLQDAGLEVAGLASFFRRLESENGDLPGALSLLSTHPPSGERAALVEQAGEGGGDAGLSKRDWQALRAICGS